MNDPEVLARIRDLAVPPAWTDVWICTDTAGHLQAAGTDAAGRRQYLYHDEWRRRRDRGKFERIESFAEQLPSLRRRVRAELAGRDVSAKDFRTWHATVLAAVALARRDPPASATAAKREASAAIKEVAAQLGNTPAVCRASYVDPRVIDRFREGTMIALPRRASLSPLQPAVEARVLELLRGGRATTATAA